MWTIRSLKTDQKAEWQSLHYVLEDSQVEAMMEAYYLKAVVVTLANVEATDALMVTAAATVSYVLVMNSLVAQII